MSTVSVVKVNKESIEFSNGVQLFSSYEHEYNEDHFLSFADINLEDFEGLEFELSNDDFFNKIDGYGIELIPINGPSVKIPGHGLCSSNLSLVITNNGNFRKTYNISEC